MAYPTSACGEGSVEGNSSIHQITASLGIKGPKFLPRPSGRRPLLYKAAVSLRALAFRDHSPCVISVERFLYPKVMPNLL